MIAPDTFRDVISPLLVRDSLSVLAIANVGTGNGCEVQNNDQLENHCMLALVNSLFHMSNM